MGCSRSVWERIYHGSLHPNPLARSSRFHLPPSLLRTPIVPVIRRICTHACACAVPTVLRSGSADRNGAPHITCHYSDTAFIVKRSKSHRHFLLCGNLKLAADLIRIVLLVLSAQVRQETSRSRTPFLRFNENTLSGAQLSNNTFVVVAHRAQTELPACFVCQC